MLLCKNFSRRHKSNLLVILNHIIASTGSNGSFTRTNITLYKTIHRCDAVHHIPCAVEHSTFLCRCRLKRQQCEKLFGKIFRYILCLFLVMYILKSTDTKVKNKKLFNRKSLLCSPQSLGAFRAMNIYNSIPESAEIIFIPDKLGQWVNHLLR